MAIDLSMFHSVDENGNDIELPRPETKSWSDVIQCMNHWQGKGDNVVNRFIELYLLGIQWDWYADYKQWEQTVLAIQEQNANRKPDEEGNLPEPLPLPESPPQPVPEAPHVLYRKALDDINAGFEAMINWQKNIAAYCQAAVMPV